MLKVGDRVEWVSQARGCASRKQGKILEIVPAMEVPANSVKACGPTLHGEARGFTSAVVEVTRVDQGGGRGRNWRELRKPKLYRPRMSILRKAGASQKKR
jgi:hypothetical protein